MATKDQQLKDVVVGLALGTLANGVISVTSNKATLAFAFNHAWRNWRKADEFPAFRSFEAGDLFWRGVHKSKRRQGVPAAWHYEQWVSPYVTYEDWTVEDTLDLHSDARVSANDWIDLGRTFAEYFDLSDIRRC